MRASGISCNATMTQLTMISNLLVSKARKPKFDLSLKIFDLNNVPLVTGSSYVKWHLPSSTAAEHRGRTGKSQILEHKVLWDYSKTIPVRLTIDKSNNLTECLTQFEVVQDFHNIGTKVERHTLGSLSLNLSEYVEECELGLTDGSEDGVVRRYLLMDSKINSTLKIGIYMKQVDGERNYVAPPLKTAPVFGGIAGIMTGEQPGEPDDSRHDMPSLSKHRDQSELQDMYRRSLAASWAANINELSADQCIEDIFSGGDGWKNTYNPTHAPTNRSSSTTPRISAHMQSHHDHHFDEDSHHGRRHHRTTSGSSSKSASTLTKKSSLQRLRGHKHSGSQETVGMGRQLDGHVGSDDGSNLSDRGTVSIGGVRRAREVDEFDIREDLVAWRLPGTAKT
ncbi:N-terminal C2 in EEIG1 and EHBP1 proteins-domain-containing protein [Amylocarpus encephaloides]|uniref:N-terminal C2 in EEIG1 and EHBP1 proteins-domain-containing protein n=1 Tax=Amylocarpus encephaloides TaxID=45428 RepID=A0A9P7YM66_9HELO|nr:N-terminal C2 in EEIG1 and EHBP1 proteins-domain-containing protein [Amylocarpus encephaloides]